jgi:hypothetical protein
MKLGTSVRFLFPTSPATHERFRRILASMPKGAFIDYVMVRHIVGDHQLMLRSFERIGRDVMPRVRDL